LNFFASRHFRMSSPVYTAGSLAQLAWDFLESLLASISDCCSNCGSFDIGMEVCGHV
jgi:hypothetical protein